MTNENTPDDEATIGLEEAAEKAGLTVGAFKNAVAKLNKAGNDLRAPAQKGIRTRRYDRDKLNAWIQTRKTAPQPSASAHTIQATAKHTKETWTATLETGDTAVGKTLHSLKRNAAALAAHRLDVPAYEVRVELDVETPGDAGERWAAAARKIEEGQKLIAEAMDERQAVVAELRASGGHVQEDIALMLGISQQRVVQFLQGAKS